MLLTIIRTHKLKGKQLSQSLITLSRLLKDSINIESNPFLDAMDYGKITTVNVGTFDGINGSRSMLAFVQKPTLTRITYNDKSYVIQLPYVIYGFVPRVYRALTNFHMKSLYCTSVHEINQFNNSASAFLSKNINTSSFVFSYVYLSDSNPFDREVDLKLIHKNNGIAVDFDSLQDANCLLGGEIPNTYESGAICHGSAQYGYSLDFTKPSTVLDLMSGFWSSKFNNDLYHFKKSHLSKELSNVFGLRVGTTHVMYELLELLDEDSVLKIFENINNKLSMQHYLFSNRASSKRGESFGSSSISFYFESAIKRENLRLRFSNLILKAKKYDKLLSFQGDEEPLTFPEVPM